MRATHEHQPVSDSARATPASDGRIRRLSANLINQIAAGEVVTRPAAALKELIENSLDAGATRIEIHVEEDTLNFMVRDDGCGMDAGNLQLAVERYATSKIRSLEDLERIATRGFRGEALAAIGAVSRLEIVSRTADEPTGHCLRLNGGADLRIVSVGAPVGTTVHVRDLFFNTPARLKFLKNPVAEWGHMLQATIRQALTRPDVGFAIRWKGRPYMDLPAGQSLRARLAEVLPGQAGRALIDVEGTLREVGVRGVVTHPNDARRDRRHQYYFINGRPVAFRPLQFALEEAFRGLLMTQRFPMCAMMIDVPGEMVDVNVHPTKEEVRLRNDSLVTGAVHRAVAEALRAADLVPTLKLVVPTPGLRLISPAGGSGGPGVPSVETHLDAGASPPSPASSWTPAPEQRTRQPKFVAGFGLPSCPAGAAAPEDEQPPSRPPHPEEAYAEPAAIEEATLIARLRAAPRAPRALAQIGLTYIIAEGGEDDMLVIDQHAAHEKILYLDYMRQAAAGEVVVQPLMIPHSVDVAPGEAPALEALLPALAEAGFDVAPFGGRTFVVQAMPAALERLDVGAFLRDLIDDLGGGDLGREIERVRHAIGARAACRAAVKAGDRLTQEEMQRLVHQLLETAEALRCPHGRPTVLRLTREQLDRQFGRLG